MSEIIEPLLTSGRAAESTGTPGWRDVADSLRRPYRVTLSMVILVSLVPIYLFIPNFAIGPVRAPEVALDRLVPLQPAWVLIYAPLYGFLILLAILVVRQEDQIRRTVRAYLTVWLTAYAFFILYPTVAPRPDEVAGSGFTAWALRSMYGADPPYNCFPSLHVAHSFVSALTVWRVHRGVGAFAIGAALLVGLSTLYTKQHWFLDVVAGIALASLACFIFLRGHRRDSIPPLERRLAPALAVVILAAAGAAVIIWWTIYRLAG